VIATFVIVIAVIVICGFAVVLARAFVEASDAMDHADGVRDPRARVDAPPATGADGAPVSVVWDGNERVGTPDEVRVWR